MPRFLKRKQKSVNMVAAELSSSALFFNSIEIVGLSALGIPFEAEPHWAFLPAIRARR